MMDMKPVGLVPTGVRIPTSAFSNRGVWGFMPQILTQVDKNEILMWESPTPTSFSYGLFFSKIDMIFQL